MNELGEQPLCIPGKYNRSVREQMDQLPIEQQISQMANHPVTHFLGGTPPEQAID